MQCVTEKLSNTFILIVTRLYVVRCANSHNKDDPNKDGPHIDGGTLVCAADLF